MDNESLMISPHKFSGLVGGWYYPMDLKQLSDPDSIGSLYKVWDGKINHGNYWSMKCVREIQGWE